MHVPALLEHGHVLEQVSISHAICRHFLRITQLPFCFHSNGVLEEFARFINCLMHALSKCLQRACKAVFGKQGMGQNSCLQMIFSIVRAFKSVKEEGGIKLADTIQALVVEQLVDDGNMQTELESNCSQGLEKFMDVINACLSLSKIIRKYVR